MVQVFGTTYRIVARADAHQVIRIADDRLVGTFRHQPTLEVLAGELDPTVLLRIAGEARKEARLAWSSKRPNAATKWAAWLRTARADWLYLLDTLIWFLLRGPGDEAHPVLLASAGYGHLQAVMQHGEVAWGDGHRAPMVRAGGSDDAAQRRDARAHRVARG